MAGSNEVVDTAAAAIKDALAALTSEETRLAGELADVKAKRKDLEKAHASLTGTKPARRRGRPRKADTAQAAAA